MSIDDVPCTLKISIALIVHSLDLRWSENHSSKYLFLKASHESKNERYLMRELCRQS